MAQDDIFRVKCDKADIMALKALKAGNANEGQQQRALSCIIQDIAGEPSTSFRTGESGDRETAFLEGRRFVGRSIVKLVLMDTKDIK